MDLDFDEEGFDDLFEKLESMQEKADELKDKGPDDFLMTQFQRIAVIMLIDKVADQQENPKEFKQNILDYFVDTMNAKKDIEMKQLKASAGDDLHFAGVDVAEETEREWEKKMDKTIPLIEQALGLQESEEEPQDSSDEQE